MKIILTILIFICFISSANAQTTADKLSDEAYSYYENNRNIDSALFCYLQLRTGYPGYKEAHILSQVARCHLKLGDEENAEKYYLSSTEIDKWKDSSGLSQWRSSLELADLYYKQKKYEKALSFYNASVTTFKPLRRMGCGRSHYYERFRIADKKSLCFDGLQAYDSVLKVLTPHIFQSYENAPLDSVEWDEVSRLFAKAAINALGQEKAKQELIKAVMTLHYEPYFEKNVSAVSFSLDCTLNYAGNLCTVLNGYITNLDSEKDIPFGLSKEDLINEIMNSPAYKFIMYYECNNVTTSTFIN